MMPNNMEGVPAYKNCGTYKKYGYDADFAPQYDAHVWRWMQWKANGRVILPVWN